MTVLDYFVLLVVLASVASGATKGIIRVIISVAFTVAGLVVAAYSYTYAASLLRRNLLIYGIGGIVAPFPGIWLIDQLLVSLHLA